MPRFCNRCNRPLTPKHHDVTRYTEADEKAGIIPDGKLIGSEVRVRFLPDGAPISATQHARIYACRVRLIGTSPVSGRPLAVASPSPRLKQIDPRYVHTERLQPGGDLHVLGV